MGAWGRDQKATGIVRMMADGNADFSKAIGLSADFSQFGMGTRSQRYSMLVKNGVVIITSRLSAPRRRSKQPDALPVNCVFELGSTSTVFRLFDKGWRKC
jgi:peroxiredoxin